jgi:uncharacterized protein (TIGR03084 family)
MTAPDGSNAVLGDLAAEQDQLDEVLGRLGRGDWERPSAAAGWTVCDVVLHLAQTEELVIASAQGELASFSGRAGAEPIDDAIARSVADERGAPPEAVYQRWRTARGKALDLLRSCAPGTRLPWATGPLSPATLATTRLAEHWAHALDITGPLGIAYPDTGRLRHVAWLAVRTLPYAFAVAGQEPGAVRCELVAPDGGLWPLGPPEAESVITGPAGAFCRVAAQRLPPEASGLTATGPRGAAALRVMRTYAA